MKYIGVDYGDARIGVSVSDLTGLIAQPVCTINEKNADAGLEKLLKIIKERGAGAVVMGLPKNMDGSEGPRALATKAFAERLRAAAELPVIFFDERLSSVSAHRALAEGGVSGKKRKGLVDKIAAVLILQNFLDSKR